MTPLQMFLLRSGDAGKRGFQPAFASGGPSDTGRYGVTNTTPLSLMSMLDPTRISTVADLGMRGRNISNTQDVQRSLGLPEMSGLNALNPFSGLARGSPTASLGKIDGTDVSFGGMVGDRTSFTPQEARGRMNARDGGRGPGVSSARQGGNPHR